MVASLRRGVVASLRRWRFVALDTLLLVRGGVVANVAGQLLPLPRLGAGQGLHRSELLERLFPVLPVRDLVRRKQMY